MRNIRFLKTLTAGFALTLVICSQTYASYEIACPTESEEGSLCWKCGDNCTAKLYSGKMTVSGTGAMYDFGSKSVNGYPSWKSNAPWSDHQLEMTSIEIGNGITRVGDHDFALAYNVTEIKLGNTLESLGTSAFHSSSVQEIKIPASVKYIGLASFSSLYNKSNAPATITFEEGSQLESIEEQAFVWARFTSVDLPEGLKTIGTYAFYYATAMDNITIPDSVTKIESAAFYGSGLTKIYCSADDLEGGVCASSALAKYWRDTNCWAGCDTQNYSGIEFLIYENNGEYYSLYDKNGNLIGKYANTGDFGTTNYYVAKTNIAETEKPKRTYYTPAEAAAHVNHSNHNRIIFTFK